MLGPHAVVINLPLLLNIKFLNSIKLMIHVLLRFGRVIITYMTCIKLLYLIQMHIYFRGT